MTDLLDLADPATGPRRKPGHPEHNLQTKIRVWVRECVDAPHRFLAFDRSRKQSMLQHIREKARGLEGGTPDTVLLVSGLGIWCELKAGRNRPTPEQERIGADIMAAGQLWCWASSVEEYRQHLVRFGVPLRPMAAVQAMHHDAVLEGGEMKRTGRVKRAGGARAAKPTLGQIRRAEAVRARTRF